MHLTDALILVLAFMGYTAALLVIGGLLLTAVETLIELYPDLKNCLRNRSTHHD